MTHADDAREGDVRLSCEDDQDQDDRMGDGPCLEQPP